MDMITYRGRNNPVYNTRRTQACTVHGKTWHSRRRVARAPQYQDPKWQNLCVATSFTLKNKP